MPRSPEIFDPYVGKVYGNILDQYDNATYNIKLSVIPATLAQQDSANTVANGATTSSGAPARTTTPGATSTSSSPTATVTAPDGTQLQIPVSPGTPGATAPTAPTGPTPNSTTAPNTNRTTPTEPPVKIKEFSSIPDSQQVIIAQTGVTAVTIDNLEIAFTPDTGGNYIQTKFDFTLVQPGAANLLDQIRLARAFLGAENAAEYYFLLEITFVGYNNDPDNNESGGEPRLIAGPFAWALKAGKVDAEVTSSGSTYTFSATPFGRVGLGSAIGYNDMVFRTPAQLKSTGKTITEHVKSLETALNEYLKKNSTNYSAPDEYKFDLSGLLATKSSTGPQDDSKIKDETVSDPSTGATEQTNVPSNTQTTISDAEQASDVNRASKKSAGTASEQLQPGSEIVLSEQSTLKDYFAKLLAMNKEFRNKVTPLKDIDDPASEVDPNKLFTSWFTVEMDTELLSYDPNRADYTKRYIVRPLVYKTSRPDIQRLVVNESTTNKELAISELAANRILEQIVADGNLHKSYKYLFTGENDQIIDLNIRLDAIGAVITTPPRGGFIGDTSVTSSVALTPTLPATSTADIFSSIKTSVDKIKNAKTLANLIKNISTLDREKLATELGLTDEQLKNSLADSTGKAAQALAAQIDAVTLAKAASANVVLSGNSNSTPTDGASTNLDGTPYTPEASGRLYAEDLLNANFAGALTLEELTALGMVGVNGKTPDEVLGMTQPINSVNTTSSPAETATYSDGGIGNALFSYVYQQHTTRTFLQALDMTLRGDPWYLGTATAEKSSTPDAGKFGTSSLNYFLLTIASPLPFDLDTRDEDNNSGYWNMNGLSQSFSGLYSVVSVVNKFSGGQYTCELSGTKHYGIPLYKIRPKKPNEKPENYIVDGVDISQDPKSYIFGTLKPTDGEPGVSSPGGVITGTSPAGKPLSKDPAEAKRLEDAYWSALEAKEASRRTAAGLPVKFSEAERNAIKGILASEGGDPGSNLATMLNRSYQTFDATGRPTPINEIVFAKNQFTPAAAASVGVNDVVAGSDPAGAKRFVGGYTSTATTNLSAAIGSYEQPLSAGVNYFRSDKPTPDARLYSTINGQYYSAGKPGNFGTSGERNEAVFFERNKIIPPGG